MSEKVKKTLPNFLIFAVLLIILFLAIYFFRASSIRAQEEMKIFPTG